jgi:hypothetical protein
MGNSKKQDLVHEILARLISKTIVSDPFSSRLSVLAMILGREGTAPHQALVAPNGAWRYPAGQIKSLLENHSNRVGNHSPFGANGNMSLFAQLNKNTARIAAFLQYTKEVRL